MTRRRLPDDDIGWLRAAISPATEERARSAFRQVGHLCWKAPRRGRQQPRFGGRPEKSFVSGVYQRQSPVVDPGTVPPRGRRLGTFPQTCRRCAPPVTSARPTSFASQRTQASFTFQIRGFGWSRCKQHGTFMFASPRDARERNGRQMHGNGARRYGEGRAWSPRRFYGPLARCRQKRKRKKTRWRRRRGRRDLRNGCRYSLRP